MSFITSIVLAFNDPCENIVLEIEDRMLGSSGVRLFPPVGMNWNEAKSMRLNAR
jgi:hypothetical protein